MLNLERFDQQEKLLAHDVSLITAKPRNAERLKNIYYKPAEQIYELQHTLNEPVLCVNHRAPSDIADEIQSAYEKRFLS